MMFFVYIATKDTVERRDWRSNFLLFLGDSIVLAVVIFLLIYCGMNGYRAAQTALALDDWVRAVPCSTISSLPPSLSSGFALVISGYEWLCWPGLVAYMPVC